MVNAIERFVCELYEKKMQEVNLLRYQLKCLHFVLAQSGNSIIATACPLKSS